MGEGAIWSKYTCVCCDSILMEAGRRHKGDGTELSIACRSEYIVSVQLLLNHDKDKKTKKKSSALHSLYWMVGGGSLFPMSARLFFKARVWCLGRRTGESQCYKYSYVSSGAAVLTAGALDRDQQVTASSSLHISLAQCHLLYHLPKGRGILKEEQVCSDSLKEA